MYSRWRMEEHSFEEEKDCVVSIFPSVCSSFEGHPDQSLSVDINLLVWGGGGVCVAFICNLLINLL